MNNLDNELSDDIENYDREERLRRPMLAYMHISTPGGGSGVTNLLRPEMEVLRYRGGLPLAQEPCNGEGAEDNAKRSNSGNPDVDEAWREVISNGAQRTPTLLIAAQRLLE